MLGDCILIYTIDFLIYLSFSQEKVWKLKPEKANRKYLIVKFESL